MEEGRKKGRRKEGRGGFEYIPIIQTIFFKEWQLCNIFPMKHGDRRVAQGKKGIGRKKGNSTDSIRMCIDK